MGGVSMDGSPVHVGGAPVGEAAVCGAFMDGVSVDGETTD